MMTARVGPLPRSAGRRRYRRAAWQIGLVCGVLAAALYGFGAARGVEWQDAGYHQYRILTGQLENPLGLALSHPLYYYCGRLSLHVPVGDVLGRMNLMSAAAGAVAIGALAALTWRLTRSRTAAAVAAATAGLAHSFWQMSSLAETYTLAAALMGCEWLCLLTYLRTRRPAWLVAVFALNGLHVADHLLGLLPLAAYGILLLERIARRRLAPQWLLAAGVVWTITAAPYWTLVLAHYLRTGDAAGTLRSALFGGGAALPGWEGHVLNTHLSLAQLKLALLSGGYCFPSAAVLLALVGVFCRTPGGPRLFRRVLLAQSVIIIAFVVRYPVKDLYTFFVPVCMVVGLWSGLGAAALQRCLRRARQRAGARGNAGGDARSGALTRVSAERELTERERDAGQRSARGQAEREPTEGGRTERRPTEHALTDRKRHSPRMLTVLLAINALLPVALYATFPRLAEQRGLLRGQMRHLPLRNEYAAFFQPWRCTDDSGERLAAASFTQAGPDGWIIADSTPAPMLATALLARGGPAGVRVYWSRTGLCLAPVGGPPLTPAMLAAHVTAGGRVIAVPSDEVTALLPDTLTLEPGDPLAIIRRK